MSLPVSVKEVPFFKILIPFIAGIACQYWTQLLAFSWINFILILISTSLVFVGYFLSSKWRLRWVFGIFIYQFLFLAGAILTIQKPADENFLEKKENKAIIFLLDNPQQRANTIRVSVEVRYLFVNNIWIPVHEKMLLYFSKKDSLALNLRFGSFIAAEIKPTQVLPSTNPNQFDFKEYLSDRGIIYTSYVNPSKWIFVCEDGLSLKKIALQLRDRLITLFKSSGLSGDELAVASALSLGYQDLLDDELRQIYSSSGAMHILSVSGLHVGILYVLLSFALRFMNNRKLLKIFKALLLLLFLWFFALLTGLHPSVQRSALMFSPLLCYNQNSEQYLF